MKLSKVLINAIFRNNPVFIQMIGLCSVLAITNSLMSAIAMGIAVTFVLIMSNGVVSLLRGVIPEKIRIPCFIVVIATFVTIVQMVLQAFFPPIYEALGIFLPLIVVNCCILGEAEGFAYKNKLIPSLVDGLGTGIGYTMAVVAMGFIRELFGYGTLLGLQVLPESYPGIGLMGAPAGAFILLGFYIAGFKLLLSRRGE
ncbi:electron transport complex subunit RsxE [Peptoniphilus indolicus]|uniref:Ion-translocating oxidoreductase complex subunit E n=2 Tax=Peptoniphilus indolicus TaxID=33030 RepID=G4D5Y8_9FIRM|nr:electron transport complex subunit RsxE [Peptoniphilus indolicus]EGY78034.1 Na(+)-translocating NADH-quinone reductase subunit D [Peptoniphilus indolicus ATCC 29427]SUB76198.1 Na(+)-translocating NADH-quinone reductase subunit D [Peptoniphilus indolicus]